jgi:DNA uptake protein ComE-like DNA-binding protein
MIGREVFFMRNHIAAAALAMGLLGGSAMAFDNHGKPAEEKKAGTKSSKGKLKLVDLNTASAAELQQIPGVDAKMAKKIMDNRPYVTVEDLTKSGIPVEVQQSAAMRVTVTSGTDTGSADRKRTDEKPKEQEKDRQ